MLTFIIPIIHPKHSKGVNYYRIIDLLYKTTTSLLAIPNTSIILICHELPSWFIPDPRIIVIKVTSSIFEMLKDLDSDKHNLLDYEENKH